MTDKKCGDANGVQKQDKKADKKDTKKDEKKKTDPCAGEAGYAYGSKFSAEYAVMAFIRRAPDLAKKKRFMR